MRKGKWMVLGATVFVAVSVAIVLWATNRGPDFHGPPTMTKVAGWLGGEGECPEGVELQASPIPVAPHGPPGTFFQIFGDLPDAGALAACVNTAGGFIGWFRFPGAKVMEDALKRRPEMMKEELTCTNGRELLIDSLLGFDNFVPEYCRKLGFVIHRPVARAD